MMARTFRVGLIQLAVTANKAENVSRARKLIKEAAGAGAQIVSLPECFNSPYGTKYFAEYAEPLSGDTTKAMAEAAKENKIFLIGGTIPEKKDGKLYNTCTVYNPNGEMISVFRKMHLFDIDIPGKITFKESDALSPGNSFSFFETGFCKVGIGICYDLRFAEMAQIYSKKGCQLLIYPGAFNMTTGPAHWELLLRGRALDNQLYVCGVSPARDESASYVAWGQSTAINPWGKVIAQADHTEKIIYADVDLDYMQEVRNNIPLLVQKREDIYSVQDKTEN